MGAAALLGVETDRKHPTYDLNVLFLASVISQCLCESVAMAVAVVCVHELFGVHAFIHRTTPVRWENYVCGAHVAGALYSASL